MQRLVLLVSTLISWGLAVICYKIEQITGARSMVLLCAAIAMLIFGLFASFYTDNKCVEKKRS